MQSESPYLEIFFTFLNERGVRYCVMNNYANYPDYIPSDIDIVIDKHTFDGLDKLIKIFSTQYKLPIVQRIWHGHNKRAYILSPHSLYSRFRLQLDFFVDFTAKGYYRLIPSELVLTTSTPYKNFFIPDRSIEAIFLIMRRIIKNDATHEKIFEIVSLVESREFSWNKVYSMFGTDMGDFFRQFVGRSQDKHILYSNEGKRILRNYASRSTGLLYKLTYKLSEVPRLFSRLKYRVGVSICFLSPDGGGKSTTIRGVIELLDGSFHGVRLHYWRPGWLKPMGRLKFWNPSKEFDENPNPHGHGKQNVFKSLVRFLYYYSDYLIGYYILVFPELVRKNLVCFDRYYYDYFVDLHRYRFTLPQWLPKALSFLVPKPDIIIVLSAPPEVMHARKRELSIEELMRQHISYAALADKLPNCYSIDSTRPVSQVCRDIGEIVLRHKSAQVERAIR